MQNNIPNNVYEFNVFQACRGQETVIGLVWFSVLEAYVNFFNMLVLAMS